MSNDSTRKLEFQTTEDSEASALPENCVVGGDGKVQCPTAQTTTTTASRAPAQEPYSRALVS
jgi:hypothetical protein